MNLRLLYDKSRLSPYSVELPLSKSLALRALTLNVVCRYLSGSEAFIPALPDADDVKGMLRGLEALDSGKIVDIGEGGATLRFLTALASSIPGSDVTFAVGPSLQKRPVSQLLQALRESGAEILCTVRPETPPLKIIGHNLGKENLTVDSSISSQFVSALMLVAPLWRNGLNIRYSSRSIVSSSYIRMTAEVMRGFGFKVELDNDGVYVEKGSPSPPAEFAIEPDWSAASYFYELALILPGEKIRFQKLTSPTESLQGDARCEDIFRRFGVNTYYNPDGSAVIRCDGGYLDRYKREGNVAELNMKETPDIVPALAVGLCLSGICYRMRGVSHLRHKESDRLQALANELKKAGYLIKVEEDMMEWSGERTESCKSEIAIDTYSDHRIAMAFAPAAVRSPMIINEPQVVAKSFPGYWQTLKGLGFEL